MDVVKTMMGKGWSELVDEAVARVVREEIDRSLARLFPEVETKTGTEVGFSYGVREYIQKRWTDILKVDPEIDEIIRNGLKDALIKGFQSKTNHAKPGPVSSEVPPSK